MRRHDFDALFLLQELANAGAHNGVIVGQ